MNNTTPTAMTPSDTPTPKSWIAITAEMPRKGRRVLVKCLNGTHVWTTVAQWYPAGTMDASNWDEAPDEWWDENGDVCVCPDDGWWESCVEAEGTWMLQGVSHWMPIPLQQDEATATVADLERENAELRAEVERLKAYPQDRANYAEGWDDHLRAVRPTLEELRKEVSQLKGALELAIAASK